MKKINQTTFIFFTDECKCNVLLGYHTYAITVLCFYCISLLFELTVMQGGVIVIIYIILHSCKDIVQSFI